MVVKLRVEGFWIRWGSRWIREWEGREGRDASSFWLITFFSGSGRPGLRNLFQSTGVETVVVSTTPVVRSHALKLRS